MLAILLRRAVRARAVGPVALRLALTRFAAVFTAVLAPSGLHAQSTRRATTSALIPPAATQPRADPRVHTRVDTGATHPPVFDVHLHALGAADEGPPPVLVCPGVGVLPAPARADSTGVAELMACEAPLRSAPTDDAVLRRTLAVMARYNVRGVLSGDRARVLRWQAAAPGRFLAGTTGAPLDSVRAWAAAGTLAVVGELMFQYGGLAPGDSLPERTFALADSLGLPVALHMGPGPPGAPYYAAPRYRMALGDPLLLEETLVRHPRLRLYVMHAGWPMLDRTLALLWAHPQVYVDLGVIDWAVPRREFHAYLKRLVGAGFGKRILFGSDQMVWPEALEVAIRNVEGADYLTPEEKRDILYNNAVRFLRLDAAGRPPATSGAR